MSDSPALQVANTHRGSDSRRVLLVTLLWVVFVSLIYAGTLASMVHIWMTSETFTHGFLIAPLSVWLCWQMRDALLPSLGDGPAPLFLLPMVASALAWLVANLVSVQVGMQLAFVGVLVSGVATIIGHRATRVALFPLLFLFLAVPMGLGLEPPMMDLTAHYTVKLIQLSGIPVYQEGRFFQLPSGSWSVVEACSGVRYLIASFTLGLLFAHLNYRSLTRKLLFVIASILVPIVANVLRAYLIVMLGHFSGMKLATGVDHLVYGWVFFGFVMLVLFWIGGRWSEDAAPEERALEPATKAPTSSRRHLVVAFAALVLAAIPPALTDLARQRGAGNELSALSLGQCQSAATSQWQPRLDNAADRSEFACGNDAAVDVFVDRILRQEQGAEMQDYRRALQSDDSQSWQVISDEVYDADTAGGHVHPVRLVRLRAANGAGVWIATWRLVNARVATSEMAAKLLEAWATLANPPALGARVFVAQEVEDEAATREALLRFVAEQARQINASVSQSVRAS